MSAKPLLLPADVNRASPGEVRALRERLSLTQKELADMIGVSEYTVWRWENADDPNIKSARKISKSHTKLLRNIADTAPRL